MYKFKSASDEYDIPALQKNQLWVSTLEFMNDPMDLGFYIQGNKARDADIIAFQEKLNKSFVIISLGKIKQGRRLWNYYTDGMKGFTLKYNNDDLIRGLKDLGATKIAKGIVKYTDEKTDLTDMFTEYLKTGKIPSPQKADILFTKDQSWESEQEYRIIAEADFLTKYKGAVEHGGIKIENVIPTQIIIGYRMSEEKTKLIVKYAKENNVEVRKYTPDFRSKSSKTYISTVIHAKEKLNEDQLEEDEMETVPQESDIMEVLNDSKESNNIREQNLT